LLAASAYKVRIWSLYPPCMLLITFIRRLILVFPINGWQPACPARSHLTLTLSGSAGEVCVFDFCLPNKGSIAEDIVKYQVVALEVPCIIFMTANPKVGYCSAYEWDQREGHCPPKALISALGHNPLVFGSNKKTPPFHVEWGRSSAVFLWFYAWSTRGLATLTLSLLSAMA